MKHSMTRFTSFLLALIMLFSVAVFPVSAANAYTDVPSDAWYKGAVDYVTEKEIMNGVTDTTFEPNGVVTRAMFVTVLSRLAKAETDNTVSPFADVPAGQWYTGAVAWAAEHGIVNGVGDNLFAPNNSITRQDMCTVLARFVNAMGYELPQDQSVTFKDIRQVASYARDAVKFCAAAGLIAGYEDGRFAPKDTTTRAEIATVMMRFDMLLDGQIVEPVPMPAQSFDGAAGEDMTVSVNAPEGALPENTNMTVSRVTDEAALAAIAEKTGTEIYAAADITFSKDGAELEPEKAVEVQIALDGLENLKNPTVYHLRSDDTVEVVSSEFVSVNRAANDKALRFYAKDFSVYIIGEGSTTPLLTVEFRNKDNTIISVQALRISTLNNAAYVTEGKDYVYDPGVPAITETQSFEGWADKQNYSETDHGYSVEEINNLIKDNRQTYINDNQPVTLTYYAKVYDVRYVVYHDQAGAVLMTQSYHIHEGNTTENVKINWPYVGFKGEQNFAGWVTEDKVEVTGDYPLYKDNLNAAEAPTGHVYKNGSTYALSDELQLYPYLNTGHWLIFDNYISQDSDATTASYTSPHFYADGESTAAPAVPTRTGYEFKGWFRPTYGTDGKINGFGDRFIFGSPINEETTVVAKWEAKNTTYQVIFWQQNVTDAVDAEDSAKTYSFYKSETRGALTGSKVNLNLSDSGTAADNRLGGNSTTSIGEMGYFFTYNETNSDTDAAGYVVNGDGSTVLNVYYDRKVITYNFYGDLESYSYSSSTYNSNYPYYGVSNNSLFRVYRISGYSGWYDASNTRYTGDVYHLTFTKGTSTASSAGVQFGSIQGLWFSTMDSFDWAANTTISGNDWPYCGRYLMWHDENTGRYQNKAFQYELGQDIVTEKNFFLNEYAVSSSTRPYTCLGQDTDGNYTITLDEATIKYGSSYELLYFNGSEYYGYTLSRYSLNSNNYSSATPWDGKELEVSGNDIGSNGAYFFFERKNWDFVFESNNSSVKTETVPWEGSLSDLASYVPTNGPEGYYFDGWFADPGFDTPFDFSQEMPNHSVMIYALWTQMRFRVVLDPTGGEQGVNASDITFPGNQATTFRVDYGEQVQASSINNAQREGYTLLGWFLDKEYTQPFNFANPVTDEIADMTYQNASAADRQGSDPWNIDPDTNAPKTYNDADGTHDDVVGKVIIYAQWREDPDGVIGINVKYEATDKNGITGKFSDNSTVWDDPNIYADQAMAFGQPASTPDDNTLQFLYWEILDANKDVVGKAYPGQLWRVVFSYAKEEAINSGTTAGESTEEVYYTYEEPAAEQPADRSVAPTPVLNTGNREVTTLTTTVFSDNFDDGTAFTTSTSSSDTMSTETWTAYNVGNGYNWSNNNDSSYAHSGSRSACYQYSSYYAANCYLISHPFKISNNASSVDVSLFERVRNGSYTEKFEVFLVVTDGVTTTGDAISATHYNVISSASYTNTTYAEKIGSTSDLSALKGKNVRLVIHCTSSADQSRLYIDDVNVTETKTGETVTYELADEIEAGKDYIIVVGDTHAVTNTVYSNNRYINAASVVNNGDGTITFFADEESSLLYRVGGSSSGWTFYNQAAGKYLGLNASDSYWLSMISTGWEWLYTGTDLDNQCTVSSNQNSSGNAFRYLSYSTTYDDFTTSTGTGQNVKFYKIVNNGYTVKFMDPITNTQIGEDQIVPEGGSAVAPEAPDHTAQQKIFTGWDKPFDNITEDTVVTAVYVDQSSLSYTVTFHYMLNDGTWTSAEQTVQHGNAATAPTVPTPPAGYTFNSWDKKFNNVTSNLTINAVYKQVATKKYTITLRAVYGLKTTEAKTHINWYANNGGEANNGAGDCYAQTRVEINAPVAIPTPTTWTAGTWEYNTSSTGLPNPTGLSWPGHTFLGWARVDSITGSDQKAHPELATEADCWLIWHEDASVSGGGYYTVNLDKDTEYAAAGGDATTPEANVAADEMRPYHDMYAVWESHVFYVYHSSNGKLQAFDLPISTAGSGSMIGTFDITELVPNGYLYGGYYSTYGGVNMTELQKQTLSVGSTGWTAGTLISPKWTEVAELNTADIAAVNFDKYDGSSLKSTKNNNTRFWTKADAYNVDALPEGMTAADVNGKTMKPVADTIYYLKEVPDTYLHSKYAFVYTTDGVTDPNPEPGTAGALKLDQFYFLTAVDDTCYKSVGFRTGNDYTAAAALTSWENSATLTPKFTIIQKECVPLGIPARTVTITPTSFTGLTRGYVGVLRDDKVVANAGSKTMLPSWLTLDGVVVGNAPLDLTITSNNVTSNNATVPAATRLLYVNVGQHNWWFNDNVETRVQFYNGSDEQRVMTRIGDSTYFYCEIPEGAGGLKIQRWYPSGDWASECMYINLSQDYNCIERFNSTQSDPDDAGVVWKTYIP